MRNSSGTLPPVLHGSLHQLMAKHKHNYQEGQLVYDTKHKEFFAFDDESSGFLAERYPDRLRPATEKEVAQFNLKTTGQ